MNDKGRAAEALALHFLLERGMRLLARNYSCRLGEIDLILDDDGTTVFVEVRQRRNAAFGSGAESITHAKRAKLVATARFYLARLRVQPACRFDVVSVKADDEIEWIRDAFGA